jgi:2-methylaconitate cis-trans-isomerase PrpF
VTLCIAVAARIEGSLVNQAARLASDPDAEIRIAMPSGILTVAARVYKKDGSWHAEQGAFYRTQRRLFEGYVYVRASRVPGLLAGTRGTRKAA